VSGTEVEGTVVGGTEVEGTVVGGTEVEGTVVGAGIGGAGIGGAGIGGAGIVVGSTVDGGTVDGGAVVAGTLVGGIVGSGSVDGLGSWSLRAPESGRPPSTPICSSTRIDNRGSSSECGSTDPVTDSSADSYPAPSTAMTAKSPGVALELIIAIRVAAPTRVRSRSCNRIRYSTTPPSSAAAGQKRK